MRLLTTLAVILLLASHHAQDQSFVIGEILFFGYSGLPVDRVKSALPLKEGASLRVHELERIKTDVTASVQQTIGRPATDVAVVCCDNAGKMVVFVGLPGDSSRPFTYNSPPKGRLTLPQTILDLYTRATELNLEAVQKAPSEDRSKGYSLSAFPPLRAVQLSIRELAVRHQSLITKVLRSAADPRQRRAAAEALGYASQSKFQVLALVRASRDPDDEVRNNAIRALAVLATSNKRLAAAIPSARIIAMLNSGVWADRNKAGALLNVLSGSRNPKLLSMLRSDAFASLTEMARWKDRNHAWDARMILGRVAGIDEKRLAELASSDNVDEIINAASRR